MLIDYKELTSSPCPWCGEELVIRTGRYGEFVACAEWCGYRKSIHGRSDYPPPKEKPTCPFSKCDGSGLIPYEKDGKVMPYMWHHCECRESEREYYREVRPEDFDFPMSYSFYRSLCKQHGWPDPGSEYAPEPPPETIRPVEVIYQRIAYLKPKRVNNKYNRYVL